MFKFFLSVVVAMIALIPTWFYFGIRALFSPQGFWQEFFLFGVGLYFLGGLQILMGIAGLFIIVQIIIYN